MFRQRFLIIGNENIKPLSLHLAFDSCFIDALLLHFCKEGGMGKHVVLVVVEGGTDAISDVSRSLKQKIPAVLCEGTGRAADILSYAYNHFHTTRT